MLETVIVFLSSLMSLNGDAQITATPPQQQPTQPKTEVKQEPQQSSHHSTNNQADGGLERGGWDRN